MTREPTASPTPMPQSATVAGVALRIFLEGTHDAQQRNDAGNRERPVLGVDEHMSVVERTGGQQDQSDQAGERTANAPAEPPGDEEADDADRRAHQTARLEQAERQDFGSERGEEIETAAVHVEIDERQRALVRKAGRKERYQKVAILRMGVVVPAEAVVAKRRRGDHTGEHQHADGAKIQPACDRDRARRQGYRLRRGLVHDWPGLRCAFCREPLQMRRKGDGHNAAKGQGSGTGAGVVPVAKSGARGPAFARAWF